MGPGGVAFGVGYAGQGAYGSPYGYPTGHFGGYGGGHPGFAGYGNYGQAGFPGRVALPSYPFTGYPGPYHAKVIHSHLCSCHEPISLCHCYTTRQYVKRKNT